MSARPRFRVVQGFDEGDRLGKVYRLEGLQPQPAVARFTPRELEVIHLIAASLDTPAIAGQLGIDEHEVELHMWHVIEKLEARSEGVAGPVREGLIEH